MTRTRSALLAFDRHERAVLAQLRTPAAIQAFLDALPYRTEDAYRCPRAVLRERRAHCFDGALFAAAALRRIGHPPLIIELTAVHDDHHMLAIFRRGRCWGAIGKSNFAGLRFREPVHRSLRELVMSYFEFYYNLRREKTLRSYTRPLDLTAFDAWAWMTSDDHLDRIARQLDARRRIPLLFPGQIAGLTRLDTRSYAAGMVGTDPAGVYGSAALVDRDRRPVSRR